jgi:hypothetical protein
VQVLTRNARIEASKSQQRMLLANCLPVQHFPRKESSQNMRWERSSSGGCQCISPCEPSLSRIHKGLSLNLLLVVTVEAQSPGEARQPVVDGAPSVLPCARCLPVWDTRASQGRSEDPRHPDLLRSSIRTDDSAARWQRRRIQVVRRPVQLFKEDVDCFVETQCNGGARRDHRKGGRASRPVSESELGRPGAA